MSLTALEIEVMQHMFSGNAIEAERVSKSYGWIKSGKDGLLRNRERSEFEEKLERLNIPFPWAHSETLTLVQIRHYPRRITTCKPK